MGKCEKCSALEFSSLSAVSKEDIIKISQCKVFKKIKKGEKIFQEGLDLNGVFCVKEGVCKLTKLGAHGKEYIVKLVSKGELLGQRSIISDQPTNLALLH